jgi:glycosyltransferase involved in cell wall biosynthesis
MEDPTGRHRSGRLIRPPGQFAGAPVRVRFGQMRITYVARRTWPALGGIENHLHFMTEALPPVDRVQIVTARVDDGWPHYTDVLSRRTFPGFAHGQVTTEPLRVAGTDRLRLLPVVAQPHLQWAPRGRGWLSRRVFEAFAAGVGPAIAAAADRPDVLHVFSGGNLAAAGVDAGRRLGVPVVVTPSAHPGQWDDDPQSGQAYRAADVVLAWGEVDAETYLRLGVAEARVRISPPCTARLPRGGGPGVRASYEIDGPLVVFVGRRQGYKGVDLLVDAAARIGAGVTVALLGAGEPLTADPGEARLIDLGSVDDVQKAAWLDAADVLCLPSAHESFGLAVAEGWSFGVPALTSDIPALRSLVEAAGGGLAVPRTREALADGLRALIDDPVRARELGEQGHLHWHAHLSPEAAARRTLEIYDELRAPAPQGVAA